MDKNERKEKVKKFFMIFIPFFLISMQIATQNVASDCHYDEILGIGIPVGGIKIYLPWMFFFWKSKFAVVIPTIIASANKYLVFGTLIGFLIAIFTIRKMQSSSSYGSAKWATSKDIKESGLYGNNEGVMIGINPYRFKGYNDKNILNKLLRDDGPAHIGLFAPTRSGKGASIIINTCLLWKNSMFVLDPKGENYNITASFRKKVLGQRVIKFAPFGSDGLGAKWNPIAEVRMGTAQEIYDVMGLARMIADPTGKGGEKGDSHWIDTSAALIQTVILHLLYAHKREDLPIPTLSDVSMFLSSSDKPFEDSITEMQEYAHISTDEFFNNNIFQKIYGNYIETRFMSFNENLGITVNEEKLRKIKQDILSETLIKLDADYEKKCERIKKKPRLERLKKEYEEEKYKVKIKAQDLIDKYPDKFRDITEIQRYYIDDFKKGNLTFEGENNPFRVLLTHPRVADGAAECANRDPKEQGSVLSSANAKFNLYRDPIVANNTSRSDFTSTDILNPNQAVSIFLVIPPNKLSDASPLIRIFINYLLDKNTESMDFSNKNKQRCLLLLDEFPQLGKIEKMETGMAIIAGYGLKVLFVAQDINQVNKNYGENNSIISNCHIRIIFTPNDLKTAENISKFLGKKTIEVANKSEAGTFKTNRSYNKTGRELLAPDELAKMNKDDEIILVSGMPPIKAKKAWYFKIPYFTDRCKNDKYPLAEHLKSDTATIIDDYTALEKLCGTIVTNDVDNKNKKEAPIDKQPVKEETNSAENTITQNSENQEENGDKDKAMLNENEVKEATENIKAEKAENDNVADFINTVIEGVNVENDKATVNEDEVEADNQNNDMIAATDGQILDDVVVESKNKETTKEHNDELVLNEDKKKDDSQNDDDTNEDMLAVKDEQTLNDVEIPINKVALNEHDDEDKVVLNEDETEDNSQNNDNVNEDMIAVKDEQTLDGIEIPTNKVALNENKTRDDDKDNSNEAHKAEITNMDEETADDINSGESDDETIDGEFSEYIMNQTEDEYTNNNQTEQDVDDTQEQDIDKYNKEDKKMDTDFANMDLGLNDSMDENNNIDNKDFLSNISNETADDKFEKDTSVDTQSVDNHTDEAAEDINENKVDEKAVDEQNNVEKKNEMNPLAKDFNMEQVYKNEQANVSLEQSMISLICQRYNFDEEVAKDFLLKMDKMVEEEKATIKLKEENQQKLKEQEQLTVLIDNTVNYLRKCNKILQRVA